MSENIDETVRKAMSKSHGAAAGAVINAAHVLEAFGHLDADRLQQEAAALFDHDPIALAAFEEVLAEGKTLVDKAQAAIRAVKP